MDTRPLKYVNFRRLFIGSALTMVGSQMTIVAVAVQVYAITNSSAMVGYTSLCALIPLIVFGLIGGALADTLDRRVVVIWSQILTAATSVLLWLQAFLGMNSVLIIWVLVAIQSAAAAAYRPARAAMIPSILPEPLIVSANAINSSTAALGMIIGPLLGGLMIGHLGLTWTYLGEAVLLVAAVATLAGLPPQPPAVVRETAAVIRSSLRDVKDGFTYLKTQPLLTMQFVVDLFAMVFGWPLAVLPALADGRFGESAIGWLYAGTAIGGVAVGLFSGWIAHLRRHGAVIIMMVVVWGFAIIAFAFTHNVVLAVTFLAIAGAADLVSASLRTTMLQVLAPNEMRGRMQGIFMVVVAGGPRIGDVRLGVTASLLGPTIALWSGGVIIVIAMIACAVLARAFWRYVPRSAETDPATR